MLKLKLQYSGHLMRRTESLEKTLMLRKTEDRRRREEQRMRWLNGITDLMDMSFEQVPGVDDGRGSLACCIPWSCKESDMTECKHLQNQFSSVVQSCPTLSDPKNCSIPGFSVHHQLPELTQTYVHRVGDAIQPSHPESSCSPPAFSLSQHQGLF